MGMANDKLKELREWGTFALTLLTVVAVPVGALIIKNSRLETEAQMANVYVTKENHQNDIIRLTAADRQTWQKISETNSKLDTVLAQQIRMEEILKSIRSKPNQIYEAN